MGKPQKTTNVRKPHIEDLQEDKKNQTYWKVNTDVGKGIAAHDKIRERL